MYDTILIPTDGSEQAMNGVEEGIRLASELDATIHVLYVVEVPDEDETILPMMRVGEIREERLQAEQERGERLTDEVAEVAGSVNIDCVTAIRQGKFSHEEIVTYIKEQNIDFVVMGTKGRSNIENIVLGSTTERVIGDVDIPVTAVNKPPGERLQWQVRGDDILHGSDE